MTRTRFSGTDLALLAALYAFETAAALLVLALHRLGERPFLASLGTPPGAFSLVALGTLATSGSLVAYRLHAGRREPGHGVAMTVLMNLVTVATSLAAAEIGIRLLSRTQLDQPVFLGTSLQPRSWPALVASLREELHKRGTTDSSYYAYDSVLGWTVGVSRRSTEGLYLSSAEGIRSPRQGMAFAGSDASHRIALVGDSYTFCEDVVYEDSWGDLLERRLGTGFHVLNFGVPGYGVDQAYLKYERHVRQWKPDVVIFGVFPHDLVRSMGVYPFIGFPEWGTGSAKPRFLLTGGQLTLLNVPTPTLEAILATGSIGDLPFVEYDRWFHPADWQWRARDGSYLVRFLFSSYGPLRAGRPELSDDAMHHLNIELLRSFIQRTRADEAVPLVVYLPARSDLPPERLEGMSAGRAALHEASVIDEDVTELVRAIAPSDRFVAGARHYSALTNRSIADHLAEVVGARLRSD